MGTLNSYYPHMPIGKVWIYRLLFVCFCLFVCLCVRLRISASRVNLVASKFARWFIGVLGRESPILGNVAPQKPKIGRIGQQPESKGYGMKANRKRHARDPPFVEYGAACGCRSACVDIDQSPLTYLFY